MENKQRFISQINRGDLTVREAEDIDETTLSYAEIKAITAANPKIKRKMEVDAEVSRLRLLEGRYKKNLYELQDKIRKDYPERIRLQEQGVERIHADLKMLDGVERGGNHFSISVNGVTYTDRKDGGRALTQALYASTPMTFVAEYCGFKICMKPIGLLLPGDREITLSAEGNYTIPIGESPSGNLIRIDNFIQDFADRAKRMENRLRELHAEFEAAQEQVLQPFEHTARLSALLAEQSQLNAELDLNRHEEIIVDDNDENSAVYSVSETDQTEPAATEADLTENELIEEIAVDTAETTKENGVVIKNAEHPVHPGSDQMIGQGVNDPDLSTLAAEIIVLDTETTGLNIADELLQVSILDVASMKYGYNDNRWMTFNQMSDKGWSFKRDEEGNSLGKNRGIGIIYYDLKDRATKRPFDRSVLDGMPDEERERYMEENVYALRRIYTVFNSFLKAFQKLVSENSQHARDRLREIEDEIRRERAENDGKNSNREEAYRN